MEKFNVGDEIGHDLREGVSIDRNTLLCLPFHCVLCQAAPARLELLEY